MLGVNLVGDWRDPSEIRPADGRRESDGVIGGNAGPVDQQAHDVTGDAENATDNNVVRR